MELSQRTSKIKSSEELERDEINFKLERLLRGEEMENEGMERVDFLGAGTETSEVERIRRFNQSEWAKENITNIPKALRNLVIYKKYKAPRMFRRWNICLELLIPGREEHLISTKLAVVVEEMQALFTQADNAIKETNEEDEPWCSDELAAKCVLEAVELAKEDLKERRLKAIMEYESAYVYGEEENSFDSWYYESN